MAWTGLHKTHAGIELINQCMTSGDLTITRVEIGSGSYTGDYADSAGCVEPVLEFTGDDLRITRNGDITSIEVSLSSEEIAEGFYYREHAVYASDGSVEACLLYDNSGADADYISGSSGAAILDVEDRVCFEVTISAEASVNVIYQHGRYVYKDGGEAGETVVSFQEPPAATIGDLTSGSTLGVLLGRIKRLLRNLTLKVNSIGLQTFLSDMRPGVSGDYIWLAPINMQDEEGGKLGDVVLETTLDSIDDYDYRLVNQDSGTSEAIINMTDDPVTADEDDVVVMYEDE